MARTNSVNFTGPLQYPMANAGTDIFRKEDVQTLAQAVDQHDHSTGKGLALSAGSIPAGSITSAMIADGTIQAADIANGAITTTQIADGTITGTDIAVAGVANNNLGPDVARANLLTNGGFEVWQRGNGPFTANGTYTADRWAISLVGTDTMSVTGTAGNVDDASSLDAAVTFTLGTGGGASALVQIMKENLAPQMGGKAVTLSVRVRCSTPAAVRPALYNGSVWAYGAFHTGGGGYETLVVSAGVPGLASQVWAGVSFTASCSPNIDNAMLVVGAQPCDYVPMHPADDLARCLRYYEITGESPGAFNLTTYGAAGQALSFPMQYKARKAVTPTLTKAGTWATLNCGQPTASAGIDTFSFGVTGTALGTVSVVNGSNCYFVLEANP